MKNFNLKKVMKSNLHKNRAYLITAISIASSEDVEITVFTFDDTDAANKNPKLEEIFTGVYDSPQAVVNAIDKTINAFITNYEKTLDIETYLGFCGFLEKVEE